MRRRAFAAVALSGLALAPSAGAHGGSHSGEDSFPPLPPSTRGAHAAGPAGVERDVRTVERRMRRIELSALGRDHAIEHAVGRYETRRAQAAHAEGYDLGGGRFTEPLQPDNGLVPPQVGGRWQASQPLPIVAINAVQLHTGKILYFAYPWRASEPDPAVGPGQPGHNQPGGIDKWDYADAYLYDPATGASTAVPPPIDPNTGRKVELFCAGQSLMADGRVLITGGNVGDPAGDATNGKQNYGLNTTYVFDPMAFERGQDPWLTGPRMRQGRWYPTQVLMPDGRTVIVSGQANRGDQDGGRVNRDVDVHFPDAGGGTLENLTGSRLDGQGNRPDNVGQYPHMLWTPGGEIFNFGPFKPDVWRMKAPVPGARATTFDTTLPDLSPTHREWAGGFQVPGGTGGSSKVMLVGGADRTDLDPPPSGLSPALATTTTFDESRPGDGWQAGPTLNVSRAFANTVLLPTGKVAVVGGGLGDFNDTRYYRWTFGDDPKTAATEPDQRRVEILDPNAPAGTAPVLGNRQAEGRTYHSTALLLPDGRVWSAGDDINGALANPDPARGGGERFVAAQKLGGGSGVRTDSAEIWSPPYLFDGNGNPAVRPRIAAGAGIGWGRTFQIRATADVTKGVLVAPGATTHAVDMSQRLVTLGAPGRSGDVLTFEAPSNRNIAPPGWYMLFGLNDAGTPSVASWVYMGNDSSPLPPPLAEDPPPASGAQPVVPAPSPPPPVVAVDTPKLKLSVRLDVPSTLARLRKARRLGARVTVNAPATASLATGLEVKRKVKVRGRVRTRTVVRRLAGGQRLTFSRAGAKRVRVKLSKTALRRLGRRRAATLRIVVTAKPRGGGKAVTVTRRPVLR